MFGIPADDRPVSRPTFAPVGRSSTLGLCGSYGSLRSRRSSAKQPKTIENVSLRDPAFDRAVVLFQDVVKILHRSMPAILLQSLLGFESHDSLWITGVLRWVRRAPAVQFLKVLSGGFGKALGGVYEYAECGEQRGVSE